MTDSRDIGDPRDRQLRDYLLGRLPEQAAHDLEARYFDDEELYDRLLETQHDLTDAWARGELSDADRREVEARLLSGADGLRRARVATALARLDGSRAE